MASRSLRSSTADGGSYPAPTSVARHGRPVEANSRWLPDTRNRCRNRRRDGCAHTEGSTDQRPPRDVGQCQVGSRPSCAADLHVEYGTHRTSATAKPTNTEGHPRPRRPGPWPRPPPQRGAPPSLCRKCRSGEPDPVRPLLAPIPAVGRLPLRNQGREMELKPGCCPVPARHGARRSGPFAPGHRSPAARPRPGRTPDRPRPPR